MYYLLLGWLVCGVAGYVMMRQGFLVRYETEWRPKKKVWGIGSVIAGIFSALSGPAFIAMALAVTGKSCFKKRPNHPNKYEISLKGKWGNVK